MLDLLLMPYPPSLKITAESEGEIFHQDNPKMVSPTSDLERPIVTRPTKFTGLLIAPPSEYAAFYV